MSRTSLYLDRNLLLHQWASKLENLQSENQASEQVGEKTEEIYKVLGGICLIVLSQAAVYVSMQLGLASMLILNRLAFLPEIVRTVLTSLVGLGSIIGLVVIGLAVVFYMLPITSAKMNEYLVKAYGVLFLLVPIYPLLGYVESGGTDGFVFGWEYQFWPLISLFGITILVLCYQAESIVFFEDTTKRSAITILLGVVGSVVYAVIAGFLRQIGHFETYPTPLTGVSMMAPIVVVVHSVMMFLGPPQLGFTYQDLERLQQQSMAIEESS